MRDTRARQMWKALEPYHAITYFSPDTKQATDALGLKGGWMSYFGCRAAPLGPVGPDLVAALFYSFHPAMVARALPDAWDYAAPAELIDARLQAVDSAVRRLFPGTSFGRKWFAALRNLTFRTLPYLPWRRLIDERPLKVGNAIELRTYEDQPQRPAAPRP